MSLLIMGRVFNERSLPPTERFVLVTIAYHLGKNTHAWPSIRRLSEETGFAERTIQRTIRKLQSLGFLKIEPGPRSNCTNRYRVTLRQGDNRSGVTSDASEDVIESSMGVTPMSPKPSEETTKNNYRTPLNHDASGSRRDEWEEPDPETKEKLNKIINGVSSGMTM